MQLLTMTQIRVVEGHQEGLVHAHGLAMAMEVVEESRSTLSTTTCTSELLQLSLSSLHNGLLRLVEILTPWLSRYQQWQPPFPIAFSHPLKSH